MLSLAPNPSPFAAGRISDGELPLDRRQTLLVLNAISGGPAATHTLLAGDLGALPFGGSVQLAQAQAAPAAGAGPTAGSAGQAIANSPAMRLLRRGNMLLTAAEALQQIQRQAERQQVEAAIARFGLNRGAVTDVLAARAYVWGRNMAPIVYWSVPYTGAVNERVAVALMRHERDNPGTLGTMTRGDAGARAAVDMIVAGAVAGTPLAAPIALYRRQSAVADPELSTTSTAARAMLGIAGNQSWIAHHIIPFAVVRDLPVPLQQAMAAAGFLMDSPENLVALPRNLQTYLSPTNMPRHPWHAGAHPTYSADVAVRVQPLQGQSGPQLLQSLRALQLFFRQQLVVNIVRYHQMLR